MTRNRQDRRSGRDAPDTQDVQGNQDARDARDEQSTRGPWDGRGPRDGARGAGAGPPGHHLPAGSAGSGPYALDVSPESAGWGYSSLRVLELPAGARHRFATGGSEWIVLPLSGGCVVESEGHRFELHGRESVFTGVSDFAYLPRDTEAVLGGPRPVRLALAGARCTRRLPARYGPASGVPVELRGAGSCSRQVNNFAAAGVFEAENLIAVEVLTPGGNWSSYPPHKHDTHRPGEESALEEIYYYEFAPHGTTDGLGYQRVSPSTPGGCDVLAEVRGGDAVLIPDGWHGPSIAAPGHAMYYLNVMAGPGVDREWLICDHPDHAWIRGTWRDTPPDPRLPLYGAREPEVSAGAATGRETPAGDAGPGPERPGGAA
ncbi:5-deoxy-glucuronate isomerase [Streptomyces sp. AJS327]|uniref:5-deoxy-glucuronate isomerase n=1 Tax=Streptomyces sp. AJS327 TaxID=2545265 RepID=UPI0015DF0873|nr:5-deoxy-glucuronate isomerase [Streptomyces sp. AJS327]MBA0049700.1 5-deoxy-glucuronate isomerase [Streptomyces sp. AJS327]